MDANVFHQIDFPEWERRNGGGSVRGKLLFGLTELSSKIG